MITPELVEPFREKLRAVEARLSESAVGLPPKAYRALIQEHRRLKRLIEKAETYLTARRRLDEYQGLLADPACEPEIKTLVREELPALEADIGRLEEEALEAFLPPDPDDDRNAILEIRAGTGGEEAALFAGDLLRMYSRYAQDRGWRAVLLDASPSDAGGFKEAILSIEGEGVFKTLKFESGVHRVQRVPATEAQGRIHTSAASVVVLPEADPEETDFDIPEKDLRMDTYRASGAGGQHVNRTDSAVRLTHLPTGLTAACQSERSQARNRERALAMLKARLLDLRRQEEAARTGQTRRMAIGTGDRSEKIRTYNFPQNRVTDHRINRSWHALDRILEGDLDDLIHALAVHDVRLRIESLTGSMNQPKPPPGRNENDDR